MTAMIKRHELWRREYRADRYLQSLSRDELVQRGKDIMNNIIEITPALKIAPVGMSEGGVSEATEYWTILFTHILEECSLRGYPIRGPLGNLEPSVFPNLKWAANERAAQIFPARHVQMETYLVRYGKKEHLKETYVTGNININPSLMYNDPSLNRAIKDDELELTMKTKSPLIDSLASQYVGELLNIPPYVTQEKVLRCSSDYFVFCMSTTLSIRLLGDFEADACILITNPKLFLSRLTEACSAIHPAFHWFPAVIQYIDPLHPPVHDVNVCATKHFRYSYQKELRIIGLPPEGAKELRPFAAKVTSLEECGELITLA